MSERWSRRCRRALVALATGLALPALSPSAGHALSVAPEWPADEATLEHGSASGLFITFEFRVDPAGCDPKRDILVEIVVTGDAGYRLYGGIPFPAGPISGHWASVPLKGLPATLQWRVLLRCRPPGPGDEPPLEAATAPATLRLVAQSTVAPLPSEPVAVAVAVAGACAHGELGSRRPPRGAAARRGDRPLPHTTAHVQRHVCDAR
jgi:hypothetical protein